MSVIKQEPDDRDFLVAETSNVKMECFNDDSEEEALDADYVVSEFNSQHTLQMQQSSNGDIFYHCQQCNSGYTSIEAFDEAHRFVEEMDADYDVIEEPQWELVDEVKESARVEKNQKQLTVTQTKKSFSVDNDLVEEVVYNVQYLHDQRADNTNEVQLNAAAAIAEQSKESKGNDTPKDTGETFYCTECRSLFSDVVTAEQHVCPGPNAEEEDDAPQPEVSRTKYVCIFCSKYFAELEELKNHRLSCAKSVKKVNTRDVERSQVKKNGKHKCPHCDLRFNTAKALNGHQRVHQSDIAKSVGERTAVKVEAPTCNICNTEFTSAKNLKLHMKIHNKNRQSKSIQEALPIGASKKYNNRNQFYCEICQKSFDETLLVVHNNMHQKKSIASDEFLCHKCNRKFENLSSFEMHQQRHQYQAQTRHVPTKVLDSTAKHSFPCQYCGHVFSRPHEKVKHERIHTGEKPYECEVCGKTFRVSYSLTLHLRTHTNIRPFVCATCNKRFKSQPVYTQHLKTHSDLKPYKCDLCPKSFRTSIQLCGHKNSHIKPFNCPECNRLFSTLYSAKVHMKTHSKSNKLQKSLQYRCEICGAEYARSFALRDHMKDQHDDETNDTPTLEDDSAVEVKAEEDNSTDEFEDEEEELSETEIATKQLTKTEHYRLAMEEEFLDNDQEIILEHYDTEATIGNKRIK